MANGPRVDLILAFDEWEVRWVKGESAGRAFSNEATKSKELAQIICRCASFWVVIWQSILIGRGVPSVTVYFVLRNFVVIRVQVNFLLIFYYVPFFN